MNTPIAATPSMPVQYVSRPWMLSFIQTSNVQWESQFLWKWHASKYDQPSRFLKVFRSEHNTVHTDIPIRFWKRVSAGAPQATKQRFIKGWRGFLDSIILQASRRDSARYICTAEEYMVSRRNNIGLYPCLAIMELSLNIDIPQEITEHPTIASLVGNAADMVTLCNVTTRFFPRL